MTTDQLILLLIKNIDVISMWSILILCSMAMFVPGWYIMNSALGHWWPWFKKTFWKGMSMEELVDDDMAMKGMLILGIFMVVGPIIIVLVYMYITDMSIPDIWAHQMITKWRW